MWGMEHDIHEEPTASSRMKNERKTVELIWKKRVCRANAEICFINFLTVDLLDLCSQMVHTYACVLRLCRSTSVQTNSGDSMQ